MQHAANFFPANAGADFRHPFGGKSQIAKCRPSFHKICVNLRIFVSKCPANLIGTTKCYRRPKTVSRLAGAVLLGVFTLLFPSVSVRAQLILTIYAGQDHIQNTSATFAIVSLDGTVDPTLYPTLWIQNNATITILERIEVDTPSNDSYIRGSGFITTQGGAPLEIDVKKAPRLIITDNVQIVGNVPLIKKGPGIFAFHSQYGQIHQFGTITVNEGLVDISSARLSVTGPITVKANATLWLQFNFGSPTESVRIAKTGGGLPSLNLNGDKNHEANFVLIKHREDTSLIQGLSTLYIEDKGSIQFHNTAPATPIILYLDQLTFNDANAILRIINWVEGATYLLVKKTWGDVNIPPLLSQIYFEGYGFAQSWETHDLSGYSDYWQITPFPEPATYGAILAAAGLGLWAWKRRKYSPSQSD